MCLSMGSHQDVSAVTNSLPYLLLPSRSSPSSPFLMLGLTFLELGNLTFPDQSLAEDNSAPKGSALGMEKQI